MSNIDHAKELRQHSPAAQEAWESAQQAAQAALEARSYARRMEAELNHIPPQDQAALDIAQQGVQQAIAHATTAEAAAAHAQALWEEMVYDYQQEVQRRQELRDAQAAAKAAVEAAKAAQTTAQSRILRHQQDSLQQKLQALQQDADVARTQAQTLQEQATQAANLATQTQELLAQNCDRQQQLTQRQQQLLADIQQQQKELTQAKTQIKKAQKQLETVHHKQQEIAQAQADFQHAQEDFHQKEQALWTLLENNVANKKELAAITESMAQTRIQLEEAQQQAALLTAEFTVAATQASEKHRAADHLQSQLRQLRHQRSPVETVPEATPATAPTAADDPPVHQPPASEDHSNPSLLDQAQDVAATAPGTKQQRPPLAKPQPKTAAQQPERPSKGKVFGSYLVCILAALALALLVRTFLFQVTQVSGASMEPTLQTAERLFTSKVSYWGGASPQRGDIVIVEDPSGLGEPPYVKRVVAVAGDHLVIQDGQVYLNEQLLQESYLPADTETPGLVDTVIPADCIFVMGDNRDESRDSRDPTISFVPLSKVSGKVLWVLYPFEQWGSVY